MNPKVHVERWRGRRPRMAIGGVALVSLALALGACSGAESATPSPTTAESVAPAAALPLFIDADTIFGTANIPKAEQAKVVCVQSSRFARNEQIVWRAKIIDPATGQPLDNSIIASVEVKLPDQTLEMEYGPRPENDPVDFYWAANWVVPQDYPTGALPYTIVATAKDGRTGTYEEFRVGLAQLAITEEVRPALAQ